MKKSTPPPIPRRGDTKRYSLNQVIGALVVAIFVTFIFGTIFGLKIGSRPNRAATSATRSAEAQDEGVGYSSATTTPITQQSRSYSTGSGSTGYTGKHPIEAYRPEAEDVARHWEKETGQKMSEGEVETFQWLMKTIEDKER
jgi:hypothetical protein